MEPDLAVLQGMSGPSPGTGQGCHTLLRFQVNSPVTAQEAALTYSYFCLALLRAALGCVCVCMHHVCVCTAHMYEYVRAWIYLCAHRVHVCVHHAVMYVRMYLHVCISVCVHNCNLPMGSRNGHNAMHSEQPLALRQPQEEGCSCQPPMFLFLPSARLPVVSRAKHLGMGVSGCSWIFWGHQG